MDVTEGQIVTDDADAQTAKPAQPDKPAGKRRRGERATRAAAASPESRPVTAPKRSALAAARSAAKEQADAAQEPAQDPVAGPEDAATAPAPEPAESDPWATTWTELDLKCPTCNIIHYVPVCVFLNARESPHLVQRIVSGHFNLKRCPLCRKTEFVEYPFTYFDPDRKLAVQVRPEWEWHAGGGEEWYAARLEDFFERWAEHDVQIEVVFGPEKLAERFLRDVPAPPARR
jgi:hypothetical protein